MRVVTNASRRMRAPHGTLIDRPNNPRRWSEQTFTSCRVSDTMIIGHRECKDLLRVFEQNRGIPEECGFRNQSPATVNVSAGQPPHMRRLNFMSITPYQYTTYRSLCRSCRVRLSTARCMANERSEAVAPGSLAQETDLRTAATDSATSGDIDFRRILADVGS